MGFFIHREGIVPPTQKCRFCLKVNPPGSRFCNFCGNDLTFSIQPDGLLPSGAVLRGSYVIEDIIGEGGMGVVYSCHHRTLGTKYALKVLEPRLARLEILRQRFLAEAKIQAKVVHPHIVRVMDVLDSDKDGGLPGMLAIVMEYVHGESLDQRIEKEPLSEHDAVAAALVILDAIGFAHHAGIVHRDLKPSNIMISESEAAEGLYNGIKVMDFGIAKLLQENDKLTMTGAKMGTPKYMAPEQIESARDVDERTDLYAIGLTLYEMICGRTPFEEFREFELLKAQLTMKPPSMRTWRSDISSQLEAIVMKSLEKDRNNRYPNAESFQRALLALGGYDDIQLRLNPYEGTTILPTNQKLQKKIERAIDRTKAKNQEASKRDKSIVRSRRSSMNMLAVPKDGLEKSSDQKSDPHSIIKKIRAHKSIHQISRDNQSNGRTSSATFKRGKSVQNLSAVKSKSTKSNPIPAEKSSVPPIESVPKTEPIQNQDTNQKQDSIPKAKTEIGKPVESSSENKRQQKPKSDTSSKPGQNSVNKTNSKPNSGLTQKTDRKQPEPQSTNQLPAKNHLPVKIVIAAIILLLITGILYRRSKDMPDPAPEITITATQTDTVTDLPEDVSALPLEEVNTPTGRMTRIPAARHWVSGKKSDELHQIELKTFDIDQTEVSYYQYLKCVEAEKCPPLANIPEDLNQPVTGIGYGSAEAFCQFAHKTLPTAQQWEAAARFGGTTNGITDVNVSCENIHFGSSGKGECKKVNPAHPESVFNRVQSNNPGHLINMLGNVREWTSSPDPANSHNHITKGGGYLSPRSEINIGASTSDPVNTGARDLGFRCISE